jgi:hypothetical protein
LTDVRADVDDAIHVVPQHELLPAPVRRAGMAADAQAEMAQQPVELVRQMDNSR